MRTVNRRTLDVGGHALVIVSSTLAVCPELLGREPAYLAHLHALATSHHEDAPR